MEGKQSFPYHRAVAPLVWVLFSLSLIELFAVHFFVALRWPLVGWPLTAVSALAAVWMVFWIRSFRRLPHELSSDGLTLRLGSTKRFDIPVDQIDGIVQGWESGALKAKDAINLAAIAYPNRCVVLREPVGRGKRRFFVRLDEPHAFDVVAMAEVGVTVS